MTVYNVTVKVDAAVAEEWLDWQLTEHIPDIMQTGCFSGYRIVRLLEVDDTEGPTYAVQYNAESKADYNRYVSNHAPRLRNKATERWGDGFVAFRSVMQVVAEG